MFSMRVYCRTANFRVQEIFADFAKNSCTQNPLSYFPDVNLPHPQISDFFQLQNFPVVQYTRIHKQTKMYAESHDLTFHQHFTVNGANFHLRDIKPS